MALTESVAQDGKWNDVKRDKIAEDSIWPGVIINGNWCKVTLGLNDICCLLIFDISFRKRRF